ncbi:MAG: DUF2490 domain-containing protein, partial [Bacteroides sp.]|nr:DUF2490 domain-containing protein [Bacteroides sp.]
EASIALQYLQFRAGIGDYYTFSIGDENLNEIRLYQGVRLRWPTFRRVHLSHYARVEERFEKVQNSETRDFTMRFRYRLTSKFRFIKPALSDLYIPLSVEIFTNRFYKPSGKSCPTNLFFFTISAVFHGGVIHSGHQ